MDIPVTLLDLLPLITGLAALAGGLLVGRISVRRLARENSRLKQTVARGEAQSKEQNRMFSRMRSEQGTVASLALSLPAVVSEINRSDLDPRRVPGLILNLAEAIFSPAQILVYETRCLPGEEKRSRDLHLVAHRGLVDPPDALKHVPFGEGKIGWVAEAKVDMLKSAWHNLTHTNGEVVEDNHPAAQIDIAGPMVHHDIRDEQVLGVLCIGSPGIRPRDEKLMFQMVTNLGSLALVNADYRTKLRAQANHDGLTGLLAKRYFMEQEMGEQIFKAHQNASSLAMFMFDIDHFKSYNDTNGHPAGDELLRQLARLLQQSLRPGDRCCRYGGEEFVIAMPGANATVAMQVANRIRKLIEETVFPYQENQPTGNLTISGGVAVYPHDGTETAELIHNADAALYESKRAGRNRITRYRGVQIGETGNDPDAPLTLHQDFVVER